MIFSIARRVFELSRNFARWIFRELSETAEGLAVSIVRALVTKPSVLIFDEATSALDNRTQAIVKKSLDELKATRIIVAHRLSTIRNCDRILVMDAGRIVESGNFEELVARGGLFANLAKRQMV